MSYKVQYNPELNRKYPAFGLQNQKFKSRIITCFFAVLVGGVILIKSGLAQYFIPGDPEVTTAAFSTLVEQVGNGENVTAAIMDFCSEILQHSS